MFTFTNNFFPDLPNMGTKIKCAQNRYTAVQTDPKYLLQLSGIFTLSILFFTPSHHAYILYILAALYSPYS